MSMLHSDLYRNLMDFLRINTETQNVDQDKLQQFLETSFGSNCSVEQLSENKSVKGFIIKINSGKSSPGIILSGHCDTVPNAGNKVSEEGSLIRGRGSVDMKYFVSCVSTLVAEIQNSRFPFPIYLCLSCDEEEATNGVQKIIELLKKEPCRFKLCIVGEPTDFMPCNAHRGYYGLKFEVETTNGHSSINSLNNNAIYWSMQIIQSIIDANPCEKLNISTITSSQTSINSNASYCSFIMEVRPNISESITDILNCVKEIIDAIPSKINVTFKVMDGFIPTFFSEYPDYLSKIFNGRFPSSFAAASEAPFYQEICENVVVYGAGKIEVAHSNHEFILKDDLIRYCEELIAIIKGYEHYITEGGGKL